MARDHGDAFDVGGATVHAFPSPQVLRTLTDIAGVAAEKVERLHGIADAALAGRLDRAHLRSMPLAQSLADVKTLRGIGDFFAAGIVLRGAGVVDEIPDDEITRAGIRRLYGSDDRTITEAWRPFRMWCSVLVHSTERRSR
jgi:DNA-3-methyladenine glycosylase II